MKITALALAGLYAVLLAGCGTSGPISKRETPNPKPYTPKEAPLVPSETSVVPVTTASTPVMLSARDLLAQVKPDSTREELVSALGNPKSEVRHHMQGHEDQLTWDTSDGQVTISVGSAWGRDGNGGWGRNRTLTSPLNPMTEAANLAIQDWQKARREETVAQANIDYKQFRQREDERKRRQYEYATSHWGNLAR